MGKISLEDRDEGVTSCDLRVTSGKNWSSRRYL